MALPYAKFIIIFLLALGVTIFWQLNNQPNQPLITARIDQIPLQLWLATTEEEQNRGLSGRDSLAENEGMLFVFNQPTMIGFWMKDMLFPIDIIWLDQNKKVVGITANVAPDTYPQSFWPPVPISYVLEVNAGFTARQRVTIGSTLHVKGSP